MVRQSGSESPTAATGFVTSDLLRFLLPVIGRLVVQGRHAPGAVGRGLRQQLEDHQRHRRHLGKVGQRSCSSPWPSRRRRILFAERLFLLLHAFHFSMIATADQNEVWAEYARPGGWNGRPGFSLSSLAFG